MNHVAFTGQAFQALGSRRASPDFDEKIAGIEHPLVRRDLNAMLDSFLSDAFTVKVKEGHNDRDYKLSIAISEILRSPPFEGLLYPTIAMRADADNLALDPGYVDQHVRFVSADYLWVVGHDAQGTQVRLADRCLSADQSGGLNWTGFSDRWYFEGFMSFTTFPSGAPFQLVYRDTKDRGPSDS